MGNDASNPIRNVDKRQSRREHKDIFTRGIRSYDFTRHHSEGFKSNAEKFSVCQVYIRKRPLFKCELDNGEFDVVTCPGERCIIVHDCRMNIDMRRCYIDHNWFDFDQVFDHDATNAQVYSVTASPLVKEAIEGKYSTCLMYGQTGSGKSFTMSYIYEHAAFQIFEAIDVSITRVSVSFIEIAGDLCHDLLNRFESTNIQVSTDSNFYAYPVAEPVCSTADELIQIITHGRNIRSTEVTGVNGSSSRSHAILQIYIHHSQGLEGVLTLVDLAGSEHRIDSMYHNADRRREGAEINASLMALKECIRLRALRVLTNHQYRKSKLTMILKKSFQDTSRTVIIATVSPSSKDTEHSLNTLRHACVMDGQAAGGDCIEAGSEEERGQREGDKSVRETRFITGGVVDSVEIGEVDVTAIGRRNAAARRAGVAVPAAKASNGNEGNRQERDKEPTSAREKARNRAAAERRSFGSLSPDCREVLRVARQSRGDSRQRMRLLTSTTAIRNSTNSTTNAVNDEATAASIAVMSSRSLLSINKANSPLSGETLQNKSEEPENDASVIAPIAASERLSYEQLFSVVYNSKSLRDTEAARRRKLVVLMQLHGYTDDEIKSLAPPSPTEKQLAAIKSHDSDAEPASVEARAAHGRRRPHTDGHEQRGGDGVNTNLFFSELIKPEPPKPQTPNSVRPFMPVKHSPPAVPLRHSPIGLLRQKSPRNADKSSDEVISPIPDPVEGDHERNNAIPVKYAQAYSIVEREAEMKRIRHQNARERRLKADEDRRLVLGKRIATKRTPAVVISPSPFVVATSTSAAGEEQDLELSLQSLSVPDREQEILKLEVLLMTTDDLTAAAIFAINKQISQHKAHINRQENRRDGNTHNGQAGPGATGGSSEGESRVGVRFAGLCKNRRHNNSNADRPSWDGDCSDLPEKSEASTGGFAAAESGHDQRTIGWQQFESQESKYKDPPELSGNGTFEPPAHPRLFHQFPTASDSSSLISARLLRHRHTASASKIPASLEKLGREPPLPSELTHAAAAMITGPVDFDAGVVATARRGTDEHSLPVPDSAICDKSKIQQVEGSYTSGDRVNSFSQQQTQRTLRSRHSHNNIAIGAASAPFANDYTWNLDTTPAGTT